MFRLRLCSLHFGSSIQNLPFLSWIRILRLLLLIMDQTFRLCLHHIFQYCSSDVQTSFHIDQVFKLRLYINQTFKLCLHHTFYNVVQMSRLCFLDIRRFDFAFVFISWIKHPGFIYFMPSPYFKHRDFIFIMLWLHLDIHCCSYLGDVLSLLVAMVSNFSSLLVPYRDIGTNIYGL